LPAGRVGGGLVVGCMACCLRVSSSSSSKIMAQTFGPPSWKLREFPMLYLFHI
ncbi:soluble guanylate cyclase 88E, partial [Biomphalaria glabrata]